jgi:acetyl-CoA carboxylase carboxyl transferase subunit alpha
MGASSHLPSSFKNMCENFLELAGDRCFSDDHSLVGGLVTISGKRYVMIGQEKGHDTDSRVYRNFAMLHPEGFRKALRLMRLAEKFHLPVISLLDTPGAYPGLEAEERGQGWAIAHNLREMMRLQTPIIVLVIGEGCSGGALGIGVGDVIGMLEHSYYSVISPEGCASILWKDPSKNKEAASALKLNAENLLELNVIDTIIPEPLGGAHYDLQQTYQNVKKFIQEQTTLLQNIPIPHLLEQRYAKFRKMGQYLEER